MAAHLAIKAYCLYTSSLLFRQVNVINSQNVPKDGPCIIYGNHNNQFIDGILLVSQVPRPISFIAAAVSIRRNIIGHLLKLSGAIPVERPQDIAKKGTGTIVKIQEGLITGRNTKFTQIEVGSSITVDKAPQLRILQVINDQEMVTDTKHQQNFEGQKPFVVIPKLQYKDLYQGVWSGLRDGKCIGIFPQGGSHDRLQLLPLKAGICIMALGAIEKYGAPVTIVPCGFNYYNPQNFRSKVVMQFGPAFTIPQQLVELYKVNKKKAIASLLDTLQKMLKNVTTSCKTFDQLSTLLMCRQLYTINTKKQLSIRQKLELNRRFAKGFEVLANRPQNKENYEKLLNFNKFVKIYGFQIRKDTTGSYFITDFIRFLIYLEKCIVRLAFALPGIVLMGPTTSLIAYLSEKQRINCLKKSKVKKFGNDVVGSYKVLLSMILFPITAMANSCGLFFALTKLLNIQKQKAVKYCVAMALMLPLYSILLVKSYDSLGRSFVKLKFLFIRLFKRSLYKQFNKTKKTLSKKLIKVVEEQGPEIYGQQQNRIIQANELQHPSSSKLFIQNSMRQLQK